MQNAFVRRRRPVPSTILLRMLRADTPANNPRWDRGTAQGPAGQGAEKRADRPLPPRDTTLRERFYRRELLIVTSASSSEFWLAQAIWRPLYLRERFC